MVFSKRLRNITFAAILAIRFVSAFKFTFFTGDSGDCDNDCSGDTIEDDDAYSGSCYYGANDAEDGQCYDYSLWSCVLAEFEGDNVASAYVYSYQNDNCCAVNVGTFEDGEYIYACDALTGAQWNEEPDFGNPGNKRSFASVARRMSTNSSETIANKNRSPSAVHGYTVNGKMYRLPGPGLTDHLKEMSDTDKEAWLVSQGYQVHKVIDVNAANSKPATGSTVKY